MFKSRINQDLRLGRCLMTTEAVSQGEVVVEELPFAYGPKQNSEIVCLGCYRNLNLNYGEDGDSLDRCEICDWPLCSLCKDAPDHRSECEIFSSAKVTFAGNVSEDGICTQLDCVTPLSYQLNMGAPTNVIINRTQTVGSSKFGRYLISDRANSANTILLEENPYVLGPKCNGRVVCLECYKPVNSLDYEGKNRCEKCHWPLCEECLKNLSTYHTKFECSVFSKSQAKFFSLESDDNGCPQLDCITPLRLLLAKEANPKRWQDEIEPMEYHDESRRQMTEIWNADLINIARYLRGPCNLADRFSEDLIMRAIGILEVNSFEARTLQGYAIRCLYPITGILAHNCIPNTMRCIYPSEGYKIRLRAMRDLTNGEQLQHSYTYTLNGTAQRQEHLKVGKFFLCDCARCRDPTELGTHFSTFKCNKCENGWILNTDPLDPIASWKCNVCEFKTGSEAIQKAIAVMQDEVATIQATEPSPERLQETEKLMRKYRSVLHPMHFIQTTLRQSLIEMYGRVAGYEMVELPDVLLERKEELCRQMLRVLNVFEPGLSRARATTLYELHVPLVLLAKSGFISGALSNESLKMKLQEAIDLLNECVNILKYEDTASQEGILGGVANQALEQLKISVEGLDENEQ